MSRLLTALTAALIVFGLASGYGIFANRTSIYSLATLSPNGSAQATVKSQVDTELVERITELENTVAELTSRLEEVESALGLTQDTSSSGSSIQESTPRGSSVARSNANIRIGPGTDYSVLRTVWANTELAIIGYNDDSGRIWYLLEDGGWIAESLVENPPDNIEYVQAPSESLIDDWVTYRSDYARFSVLVPPNFVAEEHEQEQGNPSRGVSFAAEADDAGPDLAVISVVSVPAVDVAGQQLRISELKRVAQQWMETNNLEIIVGPDAIEIGSYSAVSLVNEARLTDGSMTVRGYVAFVSTPSEFYYIEVAGFVDYDSLLSDLFDKFISHFEPLE
jgi:hypothetical protein